MVFKIFFLQFKPGKALLFTFGYFKKNIYESLKIKLTMVILSGKQ